MSTVSTPNQDSVVTRGPGDMRAALSAACAAALLAAACTTVYETPVAPGARPAVVYTEPQAVTSVYVEPPVSQPPPVLIGWAPPPMLVDVPPPPPFVGAVWTGGYWDWEGRWVWAAGRWTAPPQPDLVWVNPYYENRNSAVVFITGHWAAAGVAFVPPAPSVNLTLVAAAPGVVRGPAPIGPAGVFVPAPPGSRPGIIVPAPIGTPPAVVTSAPPVINVGMHITNNVNSKGNTTNVTNVTIAAPPNATASRKAFNSVVPAQAHVAAARPAVVHAAAPVPTSKQRIPAFVASRAAAALPPQQTVHPVVTSPSLHPAPLSQPETQVPHAAPPAPTVAPKPPADAAAKAAQERREAAAARAKAGAAKTAHDKAEAASKAARAKAEKEKAEKEKAEEERRTE